jgi:diguanylate cyclase (GGDEF)-like protein
MNAISILLVIFGLLSLASSIMPAQSLCCYKTGQAMGWNAVYSLILFFILGYSFFLHHLIVDPVGFIELILAIILSSGGVFVVLVVRLSLASLDKLNSVSLQNEHNATHDALTGLANRKNLYMTLESTIDAQGRSGDEFAVLVMDLNGFKEVNDTYGHSTGDTALQEISKKLSLRIRTSDSLFRMGGDEFAAIIPQVDQGQAEVVANKLSRVSEDTFTIDGQCFSLGVSIGIALYPQHGITKDALIRAADIGMYQAKKNELRVCFYHQRMSL